MSMGVTSADACVAGLVITASYSSFIALTASPACMRCVVTWGPAWPPTVQCLVQRCLLRLSRRVVCAAQLGWEMQLASTRVAIALLLCMWARSVWLWLLNGWE